MLFYGNIFSNIHLFKVGFMNNLIIADKEGVESAVQKGERLALFIVGEDGTPVRFVSGVHYSTTFDLHPNNKYVEKAIEYIEDNYYKDIRLSDLADFCDISSSHLCRLFSSVTGSSVSDYILSFRMNRAAYLLVNTDETAATIAHEVGYPDCGYFHKLFRSFFGVTPLTYRRSPGLL